MKKPSKKSSRKSTKRFFSSLGISVSGRIRTYFITGILITAPLFITVQLAWWLIEFVDSNVTPFIPRAYNPRYLLQDYLDIPVIIPGIGVIMLILFLILVGAMTAGVLGRWFVARGEYLLDKTPLVRTVYSASKQILSTFIEKQSDSFRQAVLLEYPRKGLWAIAFVTGSTEGELRRKLRQETVNVFLPTTPNPTSGFLLMVPKKDIVILDMDVEEAVKLVISAGIVQAPEKLPEASPKPSPKKSAKKSRGRPRKQKP